MKVCVQAIWENVATKVKLLCVMCKLSCKVCSQESCSLELECKAGGKFHMKLNICLRLIVYKYHEGNVKRTLKRKLQVPEIAGMKANDMMLFSKIAVCRHQAGCISCAFCACVGIQCILLCMPWWSCMSIPNMHKWHAYCMLWICPYMVCSLVFVAGCCAPCLLAARVPTWPIAWMWCFIWPVLKHGPRSLIHVQICGLLFGVQWKWQLGCVHW